MNALPAPVCVFTDRNLLIECRNMPTGKAGADQSGIFFKGMSEESGL
jgi:hypothetical protein